MGYGMSMSARERAVKEVLVGQLRSSGIPAREVAEWLWEDFGIRVRGEWSRVERAILSRREITSQDLAVFMIDHGIEPEEGAWDVYPARMRALRDAEGASQG
ncbi:MAG: hypothetical protein F7C08_02300 [Desulfurococcales archaeon]|nr:hypothetical protein [Desulfurococcales archaeon]